MKPEDERKLTSWRNNAPNRDGVTKAVVQDRPLLGQRNWADADGSVHRKRREATVSRNGSQRGAGRRPSGAFGDEKSRAWSLTSASAICVSSDAHDGRQGDDQVRTRPSEGGAFHSLIGVWRADPNKHGPCVEWRQYITVGWVHSDSLPLWPFGLDQV